MNTKEQSGRVVLITGATSGIGWATAEWLARSGMTVFGTGRAANPQVPRGVRPLQLDVCSNDSVLACVNSLLQQSGKIDVLINNAAQYLLGAIEETTESEAQELFNANFWGVTHMVEAVMPYMRQLQAGRIVNIGSIVGNNALPIIGYYSATKFALRGYTQALRHEVLHLGIHVSLVAPSDFRTNLYRRSSRTASRLSEYDLVRRPVQSHIDNIDCLGEDPVDVARAIAAILDSPRPKFEYCVGTTAKRVAQLQRWLSQDQFERGLRKRFGLQNSVFIQSPLDKPGGEG